MFRSKLQLNICVFRCFNSKRSNVRAKHLSVSLFFFLNYYYFLLLSFFFFHLRLLIDSLYFLYFDFQIGNWSAIQRVVFYDSILPNIEQPDQGSLGGSFYKVVIVLVRKY